MLNTVSRRGFLVGSAAAVGGLVTGTGRALATTTGLSHPTPHWYPAARFGIFIHWGVYSVPAWGDPSHSAEWYWYATHVTAAGQDGTRQHDLATYGQQHAYDAFIPRFTAREYDPHAWVRLFEAAGARYFVLTAKHHEGFQLFGNPYSGRNAVALGPHRDLVGELFAAAEHTNLRRGLYYSLGEFYNPALGTAPTNAYTGQPVPYTGYRPVTDYVRQYEHPHLRHLIDVYRPDVLWADGEGHYNFGGGQIFRPQPWNWYSDEILEYYYARHPEGAANDRFEASHADFTTIEGDKPSYQLDPNPWEACLTMGDSWGYNTNENPALIKSPTTLVWLLVDIVSKNGNLLLNIGPRADGTIVDWMSERLLSMGAWLRVNGAAIYDSRPWQRAADGDLRYTVTDQGFHIINRTWPTGGSLTVPGDLPIAADARIVALARPDRPLPWRRVGDSVVISLPDHTPADSDFAAAFRVTT